MGLFDGPKDYYTNLSAREQKLVGIMVVVVAIMLVALPIWFLITGLSDLQDENDELAKVVSRIQSESGAIHQREAELEAIERRYRTAPPVLSSFLSSKASAVELNLREINDQPEAVTPDGEFRRRHVRAKLPGVGLKPTIDMIASIENSPYPVAIELLDINHRGTGDRYTVEVGVISYEREGAAPAPRGGGDASGGMTSMNGPPRE